MFGENPNISLRKIAAALTVMGIPNTKGSLVWKASSANHVVKKARAFLEEQGHKS
jgi:hypothetical protein